jgi:acyl-CoA dehydrogenase
MVVHPHYRVMVWALETEPEFQSKLDWDDQFARDEVEPLDLVLVTI